MELGLQKGDKPPAEDFKCSSPHRQVALTKIYKKRVKQSMRHAPCDKRWPKAFDGKCQGKRLTRM